MQRAAQDAGPDERVSGQPQIPQPKPRAKRAPHIPISRLRTQATTWFGIIGLILCLIGCTDQSSDAPTTGAPTTGTSDPTLVNCVDSPSLCGFPDGSNTGVPKGTTLKDVPGEVTSGKGWAVDPRGWITVDEDGAVLDGINTSLSIDVSASNVRISNSRITLSGETWAIVTRNTTNVTVENNDISSEVATGPDRLMVGIKDINGGSSNLSVIGNKIFHTATGVQIDSGVIRDNYIYDLGYTEGDHVNGTTSNAGINPLTIQHNTILNPHSQTDAISLFQDFGPQSNRLIDNNLIAGGSYTIYAGATAGKESGATNIRITNNRVSRIYFPKGGDFGPGNAYTLSGGNTWTGNIWDDDGAPIPPP